MIDFIRKTLVNVMWKNLKTFDEHYKCDNGETISITGNVEDGKATFTIVRTKENGHKCSQLPVMEMPLTAECIVRVAYFAMNNL